MRPIMLMLLICALSATLAVAQSGGPYDLTWSTIDAGGATATSGGIYTLGGTAGQPDAGVLSGGVYTLQGGFWSGGQTVTGVADDDAPGGAVPLVFRLHAAAPNPFNPQTTIAFDLPRPVDVRLAIFDVRGRRVRELIDGEAYPAGSHRVTWRGDDDTGRRVASGAYFYRVEAGTDRDVRRLTLVK